MSESDVDVRALVAGHVDFDAVIVSAVGQITGRGDAFVTLSNRDMSAVDVERAMREQVDARSLAVIFTDLPAGSCTMASRRILRGVDDAVLIAGTNLPTLLDFVFSEGKSPPEAARHAAERGKSAITVHGAGGGA